MRTRVADTDGTAGGGALSEWHFPYQLGQDKDIRYDKFKRQRKTISFGNYDAF